MARFWDEDLTEMLQKRNRGAACLVDFGEDVTGQLEFVVVTFMGRPMLGIFAK